MSVSENFRAFCSNLIVPNISTISDRYKEITKRLNKDFRDTESETAHSLYVGSYGRGTAIKGFSDLDMLYILPYEIYKKYNAYIGNGQSALLQAIRESIKKRYSITNIRSDGQVVIVPFDDGITFEIVPAFLNDNDTYTFPDTNHGGSWAITNPKPETAAINDVNIRCNDNLKYLCRMMRAWKNQWDAPISGLLIDTLAYQYIQTWPYRNNSFVYYDWLSRDFFQHLAAQDEKQEWWRAPGSGRYAWGKGFQYKAKRCYNLSLEAIQYENSNSSWSARQHWREIYGTLFPN